MYKQITKYITCLIYKLHVQTKTKRRVEIKDFYLETVTRRNS